MPRIGKCPKCGRMIALRRVRIELEYRRVMFIHANGGERCLGSGLRPDKSVPVRIEPEGR